jgi:hypothetical protein
MTFSKFVSGISANKPTVKHYQAFIHPVLHALLTILAQTDISIWQSALIPEGVLTACSDITLDAAVLAVGTDQVKATLRLQCLRRHVL